MAKWGVPLELCWAVTHDVTRCSTLHLGAAEAAEVNKIIQIAECHCEQTESVGLGHDEMVNDIALEHDESLPAKWGRHTLSHSDSTKAPWCDVLSRTRKSPSDAPAP